MSKHTPGPWFVNGHEHYTKYVEARIGGGLLQEVAACGPTEKQEQQEANARLIAAAPELLEALQHIEEYWNRDSNEQAMTDALWHIIETAQATIAKATA